MMVTIVTLATIIYQNVKSYVPWITRVNGGQCAYFRNDDKANHINILGFILLRLTTLRFSVELYPIGVFPNRYWNM